MPSKAERQQLEGAEHQKLADKYSELMDHIQTSHKGIIARADSVLEESIFYLNISYAIELAKLGNQDIPTVLLEVFGE